MRASVRVKILVILVLLAVTIGSLGAAIREDRRGLLTVAFLNVGQGDSIFIDAPSGNQVLIDGGPGSGAVLGELSRVLPWWDRSIDLVIPTHPDADHISGLIDVFERYRVHTVLHSSVEGDTSTFAAFNETLAQENAYTAVALRGQIIDLGGGAYMEILYPDRDVSHVETNDGSIIARLVYGKTAFMLTGDAPQKIENYIVGLDGKALRADVLKAGHHGSKTSSSPLFLGFVGPQYGIFSRGCNNSYGHPAPEVVDRFRLFGIQTIDTCLNGAITFISDGQTVERVK